ncbi:MATH and LRR domain-containing protein PFE0570w [Neodiprion pinetum]|uniref:MATH and LRR domain-containing protein PFE0570w n=1 Tax=Neodiprion pinetum TaxID=441929 RepID=UPI001EE010D2|nr:uncharacterized protein LOC124220061 isoform X1 [Neodiprion pinetum]
MYFAHVQWPKPYKSAEISKIQELKSISLNFLKIPQTANSCNMSNHSGFSQGSNISGISLMSHSMSTRCQTDWSMECSGQKNPTMRFPIGCTNTKKRTHQLEEMNKALAKCKDVISDYAIRKLMYESVTEASFNRDETLPQSTAKKLRQLIAAHEVEKYLRLPNNSNDINEKITLLGITNLSKIHLSYEEKLSIKKSVNCNLHKKARAFLSRFKVLGGNLEEFKKTDELNRHQKISEVFEMDQLQWKQKIEQECVVYEKDILEYKKIFSEWINLKYSDMNDVQLKNASSLLAKAQVLELQGKITKLNCSLKMFQETPMTLEAYQLLGSSLDSKISDVEDEIQKKEAIKKLYEDLGGTEYDQVARRYIELCKAIEKKKRMIEDF